MNDVYKKDYFDITDKIDDLKSQLEHNKFSAWSSTKMADKIFKLQEENIKLSKTIADMAAKCEDYDRMKSQHQSLIDEIDFLYKRCNYLLYETTKIVLPPETEHDAVNTITLTKNRTIKR